MQANGVAGRLARLGLGGALALAAAMAIAQADTSGTVNVVNGTRTAMVSFQVRPSGSDGWQPNVLEHRALGVAKEASVDLPGGTCIYDVLCRFEDGHRQTKMHVNLCQRRFVVTDL